MDEKIVRGFHFFHFYKRQVRHKLRKAKETKKRNSKKKEARLSSDPFSSAAVKGERHGRSLEQQQRLLLVAAAATAAAVTAATTAAVCVRRLPFPLALPRRSRPGFLAERARGTEKPGEHVGDEPRACREERAERRRSRRRAFAEAALCVLRRRAPPSSSAPGTAALDPEPPPHRKPQHPGSDESPRRQAHRDPEDDVVDPDQPQALDDGRVRDPAPPRVGERRAGLGPRHGERDAQQHPGHEDEEGEEGEGGEPGRAERGQEAAVGVAWIWIVFSGSRSSFFECKIEGRAPLKMAMSSPDTGRRFVSLFLPSYLNTQGQRRGQGKHAPTAQQTPRDSYEVPHGNSRWPLHRRGRVGLVPPLASSSSSSTVPPPPAAARLACCRGGRGRDPAMSPDALAAAEATEAGLRAGSKRGSLSDIFESSFSIPFLVFFEMFFFSSFSFHLFSLSLFSLVLSPPLPTPPLHSTKQAKQDWTGQKQNKFKPGSCRRSGRLRPSPKTPCRSATRPAS